MTTRILSACALLLATFVHDAARAQDKAPSLPPELQNPAFEQGDAGSPPPGWFSGVPGSRAEVSAENPIEGRSCVTLFAPDQAAARAGMRANLMQTIDGAPYRGKQIELTASIRYSGAGAAHLWLRVDRPGGAMGLFDNMGDRPIRADAWASYAIRGDVDDDADDIAIGLFLVGGAGRAWIDDVKLRVLGPAGAGSIAPAPLSDRGAANLAALAQLFGVLRYFHPTTESESIDWDDLTIRAVQDVEGAKDAESLAERLTAWAAPVAPTVRVWQSADPRRPTAPAKPQGATHIVGMRYAGYALPVKPGAAPPPMNIYGAERVRETLAVETPPRDIQPAGAAVTLDLGGGVTALVPVTLYADAERTLPVATAKFPDAPARPEGWTPSPKDRATRLAAVCLGWGALKNFYPYFDVTPDDWGAALAPALKKAAEDKSQEQFHRTLSLMLAHLHDGHGFVGGPGFPSVTPRDFAWTWVGSELVVSAVSPTQKTLKPGDVILEIDGKRVTQLFADAAPAICAATDGWLRSRAAGMIGWGVGPPTVPITVRRAGAELGLVLPRVPQGPGYVPPLPENGSEVAPGIRYFDLNGAETAALMSVWPQLVEAKGVIFDLRGYPGSAGAELLTYLTDDAIKSASWNVPILTMPGYEKVTWVTSNWDLPPRQPRPKGRIAFLTGGGAISYAESCMGIVEAYRLGEIVGAPTAGSNGNVTAVKLPGGYSLSFTGMKVLKHDGSRHHGVGIQPTVPVSPTIEGLAKGRDEVLDKAVEVLKTKIEKESTAPAPSPK